MHRNENFFLNWRSENESSVLKIAKIIYTREEVVNQSFLKQK